MNDYKLWRQLASLEEYWFVDRAYFIGRADYYLHSDAYLCLRPKYGYDIIKFEVRKSKNDGTLYYREAIYEARKYLTPYRVFILNVKTFFCYIKSML
jgi:hypothetical protein